MREAIFRIAQAGKYFPLEDLVGCRQSLPLTEVARAASAVKFAPSPVSCSPGHASLILWPYPQGSMDIIDRANCLDLFLAEHDEFELITERRLETATAGVNPTVVFASFERMFSSGLELGDRGLSFRGTPVDLVASEMIASHVRRRYSSQRGSVIDGRGRIGTTQLVNGLDIALDKHQQMLLIAEAARDGGLRSTRPLESYACHSREALIDLVLSLRNQTRLLSLRPYGGSQGTGVEFIGVGGGNIEPAIDSALRSMRGSVAAKYGGDEVFPIAVSPYVASRRLHGHVFDCRIFVVAEASGIVALPGMARVAREPFAPRDGIGMRAMAATNMAGADVAELIERRAVRALTDPEFLSLAELTEDVVVAMCVNATSIWSRALINASRGGTRPEFAYGSVDFVVDDENNIVPIEMNGANVGSHPAVHPSCQGAFAGAMSAAVARSVSLLGAID